MAEQQVPPDPIRTQSLSGPIAISSLLLIIATAWAIWDEGVHKRPYIEYQDQWIEKFGAYLDKIEPEVAAREQEVLQSPEVQALQARSQQVRAEQKPRIDEVMAKLEAIDPKLKAMDFQFRDRKGQSDQLINRIENAHDEDAKNELRKDLADYRAETFDIVFQDGSKQAYTATSLIKEFLQLKQEQGLLQAELGRLNAPIQAADKERDALIAKLGRGSSTARVKSLKGELAGFKKEIKQIHVPEMGDLVDRCESCHLGIRSPIPIKAEDVGDEKAFTSHPDPEILAIHDPDKFGCSPCHNGNGVAVINTKTAHGRYHHWLWPMPPRENIEAGCVQCHTADLVIPHAPTLSAGKETFRWRGCWGCHRYDGFETEADSLSKIQKDLRDIALKNESLRTRQSDVEALRTALGAVKSGSETFAAIPAPLRELARDVVSKTSVADAATKGGVLAAMASGQLNEDQAGVALEAATAEGPAIDQGIAAVDLARATGQKSEQEVLLEVKKIGPSLKEVRMKLNPQWLPVWLADPSKFRPTTKMPTYAALTKDQKQVDAIAAFIWSRGVEGPLNQHQPGDAKRGEKLVLDRGCLGCHSAKISDEVIGNTFAADLTRVGEKAKFDYLVRWVANPKRKTLPYSYGLKRDLTPDDFQKAGFPFEFDATNPNWPKEWGTLLSHQMTVMPNLRLSETDARDIASYLMAQTDEGAQYPDAAGVTNASAEAIAYGEKLVKHYGCAGCHEIGGFEDAQKIGTELTKEGSKPIERLDFGHFTKEAKRSGHEDGWYNQKGFFDRKLKNPQIWDQGKELADEFAALRMPNFRFSDEQIREVSTFLIGSVESGIPRSFMNHPEDQRKAIQEGWWVVKKYNCAGCHAFVAGDKPVLWSIPWFEKEGSDMPKWTDGNGEEHRGGSDRRPPTLVGEGARVDPQWLSELLRNPALSHTKVHRNGVRVYLNVRMPTYDLSENEIGKLVRFFNAMSGQPLPYIRPDLPTLTPEEAEAGRAVLKTCSKCHATGDMTTFSADINAPNFAYAQARLRPDWMRRLMQTPAKMLPGTNMPPWFKRQDGRWVFSEPWPSKHEIKTDHIDLMVRFLAQFNNPGIGTELKN